MTHYTANLRDLEFNLFEFLDTKDRFGTGPFEQMDADTARGVLAEIRKLAEGPIAASFTDVDAPLVVALLIAAVLGALIGWLASLVLRTRRRHRS